MKKISIVTPVYNEEINLPIYYDKIMQLLSNDLKEYDYEVLLIDNDSADNSRNIIKQICSENEKVKAIFNLRNFGFNSSVYYGLVNSDGDCTILINCDLQDPPELIPTFVKEWENGHKVVLGIKKKSHENKMMVFLRKIYYIVVTKLSERPQIRNHTGFGLYDRQFIKILRELKETQPYLKELISTFSFCKKEIEYTQNRREHGKGSTKLYVLYDDAMTGLTQSSKLLMRLATFSGLIMGGVSLLLALIQFILKIMHPDWFGEGIAFIAVGIFLLSAIILFFIGVLGEYVLSISIRTGNRPPVFESERINFNERRD